MLINLNMPIKKIWGKAIIEERIYVLSDVLIECVEAYEPENGGCLKD